MPPILPTLAQRSGDTHIGTLQAYDNSSLVENVVIAVTKVGDIITSS